MQPVLTNLKKHVGIAGQFTVSVTTAYEGEQPYDLSFVGSVYGGPVVMITRDRDGTERQTFVDSPERYGDFGTKWVERFFGPR